MERKQQIELVYRLCQRKNFSYYHMVDNYNGTGMVLFTAYNADSIPIIRYSFYPSEVSDVTNFLDSLLIERAEEKRKFLSFTFANKVKK
jgi:hypothetical protein